METLRCGTSSPIEYSMHLIIEQVINGKFIQPMTLLIAWSIPSRIYRECFDFSVVIP